MTIPFVKYHGTGNDFILIDQRHRQWLSPNDEALVARLCQRRFGIGADGLMLLQSHPELDFEMVYFNSDGRPGTMCGNGGRCIVAFAERLGLVHEECRFLAPDGVHEARIRPDGIVELHMADVPLPGRLPDGACVLDTGSPHYVRFVPTTEGLDVVQEGRKVRYSALFAEAGINVNFVEAQGRHLRVATYERGVEDETWSCGTGVTASALAWAALRPEVQSPVWIDTRGGRLEVRFRRAGEGFTDVWLCGPATFVFAGEVAIG